MRRSRLSKNAERKTKNTIFLSILGIFLVLFLLIKFGIGLLVNFSLFLAGTKDQSGPGSSKEISFISPPTLNPLPSATNSAQITISGKSSKDKTIELFINNDLKDSTQADKDGNFSFNYTLKEEYNQIKTRINHDNKKSDFSISFDVTYITSQPTLDITSPSDGQSFKKDQSSVSVTGRTDQGVSITVNGFWAVIGDNNNFSYNLPLQNGDNEIRIIATDQAGNKTEKSIKVNYSQ